VPISIISSINRKRQLGVAFMIFQDGRSAQLECRSEIEAMTSESAAADLRVLTCLVLRTTEYDILIYERWADSRQVSCRPTLYEVEI
jgi:hypothetical protein